MNRMVGSFRGNSHLEDGDFQAAHEFVVAQKGSIFRNEQTFSLAHPVIWIFAGTSVFLAAWLFPPRLFTELFRVESRMFLDMQTFLYSAACVLCTLFGVWVGGGGRFNSRLPQIVATTDLNRAPNTRIALLLLMITANFVAVALFAWSGGISAILDSLRGNGTLNRGMREISEGSGGSLWVAALSGSAVFAPLAFQIYRSMPDARWTRILVVVFFLTYVIAALMTSRRNLLARPLFGILLLYLIWPSERRLTRTKAISICVAAATIMVVLFLSLGFIRRGFNESREIISEPLRYLITPYNTQALIQHDELILPGTSSGYYWTEWIWKFPMLDNIFDLETLRSEFLGEKGLTGAIERGLILKSQGVTTVTSFPAFACSWLDFGWMGSLPFAIAGLFAGWSWRGLLQGNSCQILLYPVIAYSFMEWRANLMFPGLSTDYALMLIAVVQVGFFFERRERAQGQF